MTRRDWLAKLAGSRQSAYVPREVYDELVELHDKVAALEARVQRLQADPQ